MAPDLRAELRQGQKIVSKADGVDAESLFTFRSAVPPINLQLEFLGFRLNIPWIGGRYLCIRMHVPLGRLLKAVHLLLRNGEARPSHRGHVAIFYSSLELAMLTETADWQGALRAQVRSQDHRFWTESKA